MEKLNINKHNITVNGIQFNNIPDNLSSSFLKRLLAILNLNYKLVNFNADGNIFNFGGNKIYDITGSTFVLEYKNKSDLISDKQIFEKKLEKEGFSSKKLDNGRQVPEIYGEFEYEGKYYLILESLNKQTEEINLDLGVYKGVIISPQSYFKIQETENKTTNKVESILK